MRSCGCECVCVGDVCLKHTRDSGRGGENEIEPLCYDDIKARQLVGRLVLSYHR